MNITTQQRVEAVKFYLSSGESLRKVAKRYKIHYLTLYQWVKWYKKGGENNLTRVRVYRKPWNRLKRELEIKIMRLKEKNPCITLNAAEQVFIKRGIDISRKAIWSIWKRYGLAGVPHNRQTISYGIKSFPVTKEIAKGLTAAKSLLHNNQVTKAAEALNDLPYCPDVEILLKIPDRLLSLRRKTEKFPNFFWKSSFPKYRQKLKRLREKLEKDMLNYSAIRAGIEELLALQWMGKSKEMISLINHLNKKLNNKCETSLKTSLILLEGVAYAMRLNIKEARRCVSRCNRKILGSFPFLNFDLAGVYSSIGDFKKAILFIERCLQHKSEESKRIFYEALAYFHSLSGNYRKSKKYLNTLKTKSGKRSLTILLIRAQHLIVQGRFEKALNLTAKILSESKKETLMAHLNAVSLMHAGIFAALGDAKKAKYFIRKYIPVFEKSKVIREVAIHYTLIGKSITKNASLYPPIRLMLLLRRATTSLREGDYRKAFHYASNKALLGLFHRFILFFPESIVSLLAKGKNTGLPKTLIRLPVFNTEISVYHIKFLGDFVLYKNQRYVKVGIKPKDTAFLIYLCQQLKEPKKSVHLDEVYRNFWLGSDQPARNVSHLLVRIKKALGIPSHLLEISHRGGEAVLINQGIHFIADYGEFEQSLATALALERADEWSFAKREYLHAFKLFRGEPFKKMYDPWSEQMRRTILNKLETEVVHFSQECLKRGNKRDAKKVLEKVLKIIPNSNEIKKHSVELRVG